jgi:hypothetical protein
MTRPKLLLVVSCLVLSALLGASSALASDASIRTAIEKSKQEVKESGVLKSALAKLSEEPLTIKKDHEAIGKFDVALGKVIAKVSAQKASTPSGKKGKEEYVGALRKLIAGFSYLDKALTHALKHERAAAKADAKRAVSTVKAAAAEGRSGAALLHVKA